MTILALLSTHVFLTITGSVLLFSATTRLAKPFIESAKSRREFWQIAAIDILVYVLCIQGWGRGWAIILGLSG